MKALSLWQPWASAVAFGWKTIETRHWSTRYRGPIAIHAAKHWTAEERLFAYDMARETGDRRLIKPSFGSIVAIADLVDVVPTVDVLDRIRGTIEDWFGNYAPGRFAWRLDRVKCLPAPVPFTGRQGLFVVPDDLLGVEIDPGSQGRLL